MTPTRDDVNKLFAWFQDFYPHLREGANERDIWLTELQRVEAVSRKELGAKLNKGRRRLKRAVERQTCPDMWKWQPPPASTFASMCLRETRRAERS